MNIHFSIFTNCCIGLILIFAGIMKATHLQSFTIEIAQYSDAYLFSWMIAKREIIAIFVCCCEIFIGFLTFIKRTITLSIFLIFIIMSFFLFLTSISYLLPPITGSISSCGCFGSSIQISAQASFYKNIILWCIAAYNTFYQIKKLYFSVRF